MSKFIRFSAKLANRNNWHCQNLGVRNCTSASSGSNSNTSRVSNSSSPALDVPGLSKNILDTPSDEVGFPGASKTATYKNPEYFSYHNTSYFEAEVEMMKYRLPQPSSIADKK